MSAKASAPIRKNNSAGEYPSSWKRRSVVDVYDGADDFSSTSNARHAGRLDIARATIAKR